MGKSFLYISCYLTMLAICSLNSTNEFEDCFETGDCDRYGSRTNDSAVYLRATVIDSLIRETGPLSENDTPPVTLTSDGK